MSLAGPGLTTTSYKKRKEKITKAKQAELESDWRARNQRLKEMGLQKETYEQFLDWIYGRGKKTNTKTQNRTESKKTTPAQTKVSVYREPLAKDADDDVKMAVPKSFVIGPCSSKPSPTYTGSEIIGIVVLHKSCLQPVFSKQAAEDAAKMRR